MGIVRYATTYAFRRLFQVIYHVTFRCNAKCSFCFNLDQLNKRLDEELSVEEVDRFTRSLPRFEWLMISGGEPFLRPDLPDLLAKFASHNKVKHVTVPTNAIAQDRVLRAVPEILKGCPEQSVSVVLSLDAIGKLHDDMRGVPGTFDKVLSLYEALSSIKRENPRLSVKIETVISDDNIECLDEVIEFVDRLGPDLHILDLVRGGFSGWQQHFEAHYDIEKVIAHSFEVLRKSRGYSSLNEHVPLLAKVSKTVQASYFRMLPRLVEGKRNVKCLAGRMTLVLYPRGDVSSCEVLPAVANVRDFGLDYRQVLGSEPFRKQIDALRKNKCICFHPCYQTVNILFSPKLLLKAILKGEASG